MSRLRLKLLKNITSRSRGYYSFLTSSGGISVEKSSRFPRLRYTSEMTADILGLIIILRRGFSATFEQDVDERSLCFACLAWLHELFVGMLKWLTNACAGCGGPTLNFIERFDLDRSVQQRSHFTSCQLGAAATVCTDYVEPFTLACELKDFLHYSMRHK